MPQFQHNSRTLDVHPLDDDRKDMFARWVRLQALEHIRIMRGDLTDEEYVQQMTIWNHDGATHAFAWGMPLVAAAVVSPAGAKYLALLALGHNKDVDASTVDAIYDDEAAWAAFVEANKQANGNA